MESENGEKTFGNESCPGCGLLKSEWPEPGFKMFGETYCCRGCAEVSGCTCVERPGILNAAFFVEADIHD